MTIISEIHPVILAALAESHGLPPMSVVSDLYNKGKIDEPAFAVWDRETKGGTKKASKPRKAAEPRDPDAPKRAYVTRAQRCVGRALNCHNRFIRRQSMASTVDHTLSAGCVRTLNYILGRCGQAKSWATWTVNIANDLGLCARTVRGHLSELARRRYIDRSLPDTARKCRITLTPLVTAEVPLWVALTSSADALASIEATGRNLNSPSYEINSYISLEIPTRDPSGDVAVDEVEDRGSALVGAAPPLSPPHVGVGRVASSTSSTKNPAPGRTGAGLSAKPMRPSWPSVSSLDDHITIVLREVGLNPGTSPGAACSPSGPGTPAGSRRDGGS